MPNEIVFHNCTVYFKSDFLGCINRRDVKMVTIEEGCKYAQYDNATKVTWLEPRKRNARATMLTSYPFVVVLRREEAIDPPSIFSEPKESTTGGVSIQECTYASFDDRWVTDFQALMAEKGVTPLYEKISLERNC